MADILSQDEIDALLSAFGGGGALQSGGAGSRSSSHEVHLYDFARPERFSKEQLRRLDILHCTFATSLANYLSALLRTAIEVEHTTLDQASFDEYQNSIPSPTLISTFRIDPVAARSLIEFNPNIVFAIVDYMAGGNGQALLESRDITDIEMTLMESVVKSSLKHYIRAWEIFGKTYCELERVGSSQLVNPIANPTDRVVSSYFEVRIGEQVGLVSICIPALALEAILTEFEDSAVSVPTGAEVAVQGIIAEHLSSTSVYATAMLGKANVTIKDLLNLAVGDCVRLEQPVDKEILLTVKGQPKYMAVPGMVSRRVGVQITRQVTEDDLAI